MKTGSLSVFILFKKYKLGHFPFLVTGTFSKLGHFLVSRFSLYKDSKFWTKNVCFEGVPIVRFGWNFRKMNKIWFRKIFIPAPRLYDLFENPRSLEAARGQSMPRSFWPPYMVLKWLPLVSGCQKWPRPRAASSDLGFSKRSYSLKIFLRWLLLLILALHTKYEPNRIMGTPPNHTFFV